MAIADIQATHSGPFTGRLINTVRFVEFPEVVLAVREVVEGRLGTSVKKTASSQVDAGRVDGKKPSSAALQLVRGFRGSP